MTNKEKGTGYTGDEIYGDLELSLLFLKKVDLLEKQYSILEIGCAHGRLCNNLYNMGYHNITGIDISSSAITFGKKHFPHLDLHCMDANSLKFSNDCFDICLSFDVVEHLPDVNFHFNEVWRVLKHKGKYLFQTPNKLINPLSENIKHRKFGWLGWEKYHPSLQYSWSLREKLLEARFVQTEFIKISPVGNYKIQQIPRFGRWTFKHVPWESLPLFLQTNFYVIAYK